MIKIAITGNIGSGKSTVSEILKSMGYSVFESDKEVKRAFKNKDLINQIKKEFLQKIPALLKKNYEIDSEELGNFVFAKKKELNKLENIIHPKIQNEQEKFINRNKKEKVLFFDIPLLFEKKLHNRFDFIIYTIVDFNTQKKRVLERPNMNEEKFNNIMKAQIRPINKLREFISLEIDTGKTKNDIKTKIRCFLQNI